MSNKRKQGLKLVGAYIPEDRLEKFRKASRQRNLNVADALRELIEKEINYENQK